MGRADGFTLVELLIVLAVIGLLASMAIPSLLSARRRANEASAVASLHAVADAQAVFAGTCADGAYATRLPQLARGPHGSSAPFISPDLGVADAVVKSGYRVSLFRATDGVAGERDACNGVPAPDLATSYFATAEPVVDGGSGDSHYWLGVDAVVFEGARPILSTEGRSAPPGGSPLDDTAGRRARPSGRPIDVP